jgi:hypothetical protein
MSWKRLLGLDRLTRKQENWHSENDGGVVLETAQDVSDIIEANKADYNAGAGFAGDMRHVARIPLVVYDDLMRRGIAQDPARLKAWLNDPDNRLFRSHPGRV